MLSARELALEKNPQRDRLGQPADHLHPRHRRGDGAGQRGRREGQPQLIIREPAARSRPRARRRSPSRGSTSASAPATTSSSAPSRPSSTTRSARPRAPAATGDRRPRWTGTTGDPPRHDPLAAPVRAALPRPQPADQRPGDRRQPAPLPSLAGRSAAAHRAVPALRQGPVPRRRRRRPAGLHPGRLHDRATGSRTPSRSTRRDRSPSTGLGRRPFNYIRNSVKIVEDAYDGDDDASTSPTRTTRSSGPTRAIFPTLFKPLDEMPGRPPAAPAGPRGAVQRPDPDVRALPRRRTRRRSTTTRTCGPCRRAPTSTQSLPNEAYYVVMRMPGEPDAGVPAPPADGPEHPAEHDRLGGRPERDQPTTAPSASTSSRQNTSVLGPDQIEAQIDADPIISAQITLWNQSGSKVIRGNLIVVPVRDSLHLPPAGLPPVDEQRQFPAVPADRRRVVDRRSSGATRCSEALDLLLAGGGGGPGPTPIPTPTPDPGPAAGADALAAAPADARRPATSPALVAYANQHFELAQAALRDGDFATYGQEMAGPGGACGSWTRWSSSARPRDFRRR